MIVLKIIGWVLLAIFSLILLSLSVKVRFRIEYSSDNTSILLRWLFVKFPLYPAGKKEKPEKQPKEKKEAPKKEEIKEEKPAEKTGGGNDFLKTFYDAQGIDGIISILKKVLGHTKTFFGNLYHGFVIDELYLDISCTKGDAAATAIYYGEVCAVIFPLLGSLASKYRLKKYDVNIYPDFIARFSDASFIVDFHFTPVYLIGITVGYIFKLVFGVFAKVLFQFFGASRKNKSDRNENIKSTEKSEIK